MIPVTHTGICAGTYLHVLAFSSRLTSAARNYVGSYLTNKYEINSPTTGLTGYSQARHSLFGGEERRHNGWEG